MEDINAKRNARRKRILENSEKRLLKITGRDDNDESKAQSIHLDSCGQQFIAKDMQTEASYPAANGEISGIKVEGINNTSNNITTFSSLLLVNRVYYILLAVIVNILLILQLDHLFGKAITIPYFPIMLARIYNYMNTQEIQKYDLLYAILFLCNIKPQLTYHLKKIVGIIHMILGDLALYIFSFTLIHYGFFYHLHNKDLLITF